MAELNLSDIIFWRQLATYLGIFAGILVSLGIIQVKFISPFLAKPLAKALKAELRDEVIDALKSPESQEFIQEAVAKETSVVVGHIHDFERRTDQKFSALDIRIKQLENNTKRLVDRPQNQRTGDSPTGRRSGGR